MRRISILDFLMQNFLIAMFIIFMIITAELLFLAYIVLHKKNKKKKIKSSIPELEHISKAGKPYEKKDEYGLTVIDLDLKDDDFEFHFMELGV